MNRVSQTAGNQAVPANRFVGRTGKQSFRWFVLAATLTLVAGACNQGEVTPDVARDVQVQKHSEKGPVHMTATVDRTSAQVAEPITMSLAITAPAGVTVQFPQVADQLGGFDIVDTSDQFDIPDGTQRSWTRTFRLESLRSGSQSIPAITVPFTDRRNGTAVADAIATSTVDIQVVSLLEGQADPTQFRDIKGVVDLPAEVAADTHWLVYSAVGGGLVLLASVGLLAWRRSRREPTPRQWALARLSKLQNDGLLASGETDEFYCRLTDIVRRYIELRFGHSAPRQTTTEFLSAMHTESLLQTEHRASLQEFLIVADMVKFACLEPSPVEARSAIEKARDFVETTSLSSTTTEHVQEQQVAA